MGSEMCIRDRPKPPPLMEMAPAPSQAPSPPLQQGGQFQLPPLFPVPQTQQPMGMPPFMPPFMQQQAAPKEEEKKVPERDVYLTTGQRTAEGELEGGFSESPLSPEEEYIGGVEPETTFY